MTPDELYQKTIDDQRTHLLKLQDEFNKDCEISRKKAQDRLALTKPENKLERENILKEQKSELEVALTTLKREVDFSTRQTMKKLEEIVRAKETEMLKNLDKQMEELYKTA